MGFGGADTESEKLSLTDQLLQAVMCELRVTSQGHHCGRFQCIPHLVKGIKEGSWIDFAEQFAASRSNLPVPTCKNVWDAAGTRRTFSWAALLVWGWGGGVVGRERGVGVGVEVGWGVGVGVGGGWWCVVRCALCSVHNTTQRNATQRNARHATPRHATPRHATPRHATPRHATPRHATPRHATPRHATPHHTTPHHTTSPPPPPPPPPPHHHHHTTHHNHLPLSPNPKPV